LRDQRLLICLKSFIGDAIMALPMVDALEGRYSNVVVQTSPVVQQLLDTPERRLGYLLHHKDRAPWTTVRQAVSFRRMGFDATVLVNRSFRAALIAKLAGIPERVGHAREGRSRLLTKSLPYPEDQFEADCCLELARVLGCEGWGAPKLAPTEEDLSAGKAAIQTAVIGIQPGARYPRKQLPPKTLAEIARRLTKDGHRIALLGGDDERGQVEALRREAPTSVDLVGATPIRTTLGAVSCLRLVLGSDTGLMHVAAASGTPTITVFGPTNSEKWGHRYAPHKVIVAPDGDMQRVCVDDLYTSILSTLEA
jgi:ADP-heptose:LPS heptosyltransferase